MLHHPNLFVNRHILSGYNFCYAIHDFCARNFHQAFLLSHKRHLLHYFIPLNLHARYLSRHCCYFSPRHLGNQLYNLIFRNLYNAFFHQVHRNIFDNLIVLHLDFSNWLVDILYNSLGNFSDDLLVHHLRDFHHALLVYNLWYFHDLFHKHVLWHLHIFVYILNYCFRDLPYDFLMLDLGNLDDSVELFYHWDLLNLVHIFCHWNRNAALYFTMNLIDNLSHNFNFSHARHFYHLFLNCNQRNGNSLLADLYDRLPYSFVNLLDSRFRYLFDKVHRLHCWDLNQNFLPERHRNLHDFLNCSVHWYCNVCFHLVILRDCLLDVDIEPSTLRNFNHVLLH
mmetsp:Transcript_56192/g.89160  ORF Transcript_56192/g.89160 Transcript_56192/m.89160 type:complete len:338 (+) Transcript_56192:1060-2073(+)